MATRNPATLPETNMAPENNPLEKEIPALQTISFRGYVSFREGNQLRLVV